MHMHPRTARNTVPAVLELFDIGASNPAAKPSKHTSQVNLIRKVITKHIFSIKVALCAHFPHCSAQIKLRTEHIKSCPAGGLCRRSWRPIHTQPLRTLASQVAHRYYYATKNSKATKSGTIHLNLPNTVMIAAARLPEQLKQTWLVFQLKCALRSPVQGRYSKHNYHYHNAAISQAVLQK